MTKMISIRVDPGVLAEVDSRSSELGRNRSEYILGLVKRDLEVARKERGHCFASEDLIGSVRSGIAMGDNATVRRVIAERFNETNR
jgi:hypothetical protein